MMPAMTAEIPASVFTRALMRVEDVLHWTACTCLVVMAGLIVWDAVSRTLFGVPLQVQFELTELYLMPATAVLSISRVFRDQGHLSLDVFDPERLGRAARPVHALVLILSGTFFAIVTWKAGMYAHTAWVRNNIYLGVYDWPLWLAYLSIPLGCGVLTVRLAHDLIRLPWQKS